MKRFILIAVAALALAAPAAAATTDTASATASTPVATLGQPVTFTSTSVCTVWCGLSWTYLDGSRLGWFLGNGPTVTKMFTAFPLISYNGGPRLPRPYATVQLDLTQPCVGSGGRLMCHSFAYVTVGLVAP